MRRPLIAILAVALLAALLPAAAQAKPPTAARESCARYEKAALRACRKRAVKINAANKVVLKKLRDSRLVGTRGDGAGVDWTFCANGKTVTAVTSYGSTGTSRGSTWVVEHAQVRQGGKWFDAIITDPSGLAIAVAMRGGRWQVGRDSFGEVDDLGPATRTSAKAACAAL